MLPSGRSRAIVIIILILILFSLFIWHGTLSPAPEKGRYPGTDDVVDDYNRYVGEYVEIDGEVIETDPVMIKLESGDRTIELEVADLREEPDEGDRLSVFGTVGENRTIYVSNAMIRPLWRYVYLYGISLLGAVWVGMRIIGQWRFDKKILAFKPREEPFTAKEVLSRLKRVDDNG